MEQSSQAEYSHNLSQAADSAMLAVHHISQNSVDSCRSAPLLYGNMHSLQDLDGVLARLDFGVELVDSPGRSRVHGAGQRWWSTKRSVEPSDAGWNIDRRPGAWCPLLRLACRRRYFSTAQGHRGLGPAEAEMSGHNRSAVVLHSTLVPGASSGTKAASLCLQKQASTL